MNVILGQNPRRPVFASDALAAQEDLPDSGFRDVKPTRGLAYCERLNLCVRTHTTRLLRAKVPSISTT